LVVDALTGQAPFYELPRYDDTFALGGAKGVRGVPAQRYQGELKVFGNVELRLDAIKFEFLNKSNLLGTAMFIDAGRLWATYDSNPDLDGTGLGLKFGLGFGLRILAGRSFVIRADLAWSPDARPVGGYFVAGHMF
jgi:hemolysin activation/secretion protein